MCDLEIRPAGGDRGAARVIWERLREVQGCAEQHRAGVGAGDSAGSDGRAGGLGHARQDRATGGKAGHWPGRAQ